MCSPVAQQAERVTVGNGSPAGKPAGDNSANSVNAKP